MEEDGPSPCKKAKRESKKHVWMLTYASGCRDITAAILHEHKVACDEVYTITWRESTYTLIHLESAVRSTTLKKAMQAIEEKYGIKGNSIFGYEGILSNTKDSSGGIFEHPGFKRMVQRLNENIGDLSIWLALGDITTNKRCILRKFISSIDPKEKTKAQLIAQLNEWKPIVQSVDALQSKIDTLQHTLAFREREIKASEASNTSLVARMMKLMEENTDLRLQIMALKKVLYSVGLYLAGS